MALTFFTSGAKDFSTGVVSWVAGTYKLYLATNTFTNSIAFDFRDDLSNEVTGTNYNAGGMTLANKSVSAANPCVWTADDIIIAQSAGGFSTGRKYILYKALGGAASADPLLTYGAAAADFGNVAGTLTLDVPTSFITVSV